MKRREVKGPSSTDLLVCFPTRSHLTLMPKTICSPSRTLGDGLWCKKKQMGLELSEPTSPKVTCAGKIKVDPQKSVPWQSVMEEIERLHNNKKHKKKPTWGGTLGFKKESMQLLACLRSFKFDLGCFGTFPNARVNDDNDDDDHEEGSSRSAFSKFFMILEKNRDCGLLEKEENDEPKDDDDDDDDDDDAVQGPCMPPSNALLLMRCRSAPAKSLLEKKDEKYDDNDDNNGDGDHHDDDEMKMENLIDVMKYEGDFYKLSCDIARETWVVGGINKDTNSTTQSSKRCSTKCLEEVKACLRL